MSESVCTISLSEFVIHTNITESDLLSLLEQGVLPCILTEENKIEIDISKISIEDLSLLLIQSGIAEEPELILDPELASILEPLIEEAIDLASQWLEEDLDKSAGSNNS